jgi:hypothetical protein
VRVGGNRKLFPFIYFLVLVTHLVRVMAAMKIFFPFFYSKFFGYLRDESGEFLFIYLQFFYVSIVCTQKCSSVNL